MAEPAPATPAKIGGTPRRRPLTLALAAPTTPTAGSGTLRKTPLTPLAAPATPTAGSGTPRRTPLTPLAAPATPTSGSGTPRRIPLTPLAAPATPTSGNGTPRRTPKRSLEHESEMISSLLTGCIKLGKSPTEFSLPEFTPEKENCVRGVQLLSLDSPAIARSPVSTRTFPAPKRAKPDFDVPTPANQPKKVRQSSSFHDLIIGSRLVERSLSNASSIDDDSGVASGDDEHGALAPRPSARPFSHWNSQSATFPSMSTPSPVTKFQQKSQSESAISIMQSMDLRDDPTLIGDCSRRYSLPFVSGGGRHTDLKEISSETLKALLDGEFKSCVQKFDIVDCRYPYEYAGGHIRGAMNLYTELQVSEKFMDKKSALPEGHKSDERHIIIFHCEFSAQRGPRMCRSLRDWDRNINLSAFPALHYPELYVLNGGYKAFHESCVTHCDPPNYIRMADPEYTEDFKLFRTKSKTDLLKSKSGSSSSLTSSVRLGRQFSLSKLKL